MKVLPGRMTTDHREPVVVFLIGMRINRPLKVRAWLPVFRAMPRMLREVLADSSSGCRGARTFFSGRTVMLVQYWDSTEQLLAYAHDGASEHRPAWRDFNRLAAASGAVGIFHETYHVAAGAYETVYVQMPPFGVAAATDSVVPVGRRGDSATARLSH